jgi:error-prone DNA polymerase
MVHPYLRRRNGEERVEYPSKELEEILGRTLGVPLFQEQAMEIAIVAAGFTPSEADQLRRSMATFKAKGQVSAFEKKLISGMTAKGYAEEFAKRVFKQLEGFGSYGFPESHAVSFALLAYVSSWLKCHYPDVFAAALLNSMPMGFYQPAQIISDVRKHGVNVKPVDINHSHWDNTLEAKDGKYCALRMGFRQIKGVKEEDMQILMAARDSQFNRIPQLVDAGVPLSALEKLADADAFRSIGLDRRQALWEISALADHSIGLFAGQQPDLTLEQSIRLPKMSLSQHVIEDYRTLTLSLKAHPVSFIRNKLGLMNVTASKDLNNCVDGMEIKIAGLVLVRQRPGTASGICFITIEDETGTANLVVFQNLFNKYRKEIVHCYLLMVEGKVQKEGEVIHVVLKRCYDLSGLLLPLSQPNNEPSAGEKEKTPYKKPRVDAMQEDIFHGGRNFR